MLLGELRFPESAPSRFRNSNCFIVSKSRRQCTIGPRKYTQEDWAACAIVAGPQLREPGASGVAHFAKSI